MKASDLWPLDQVYVAASGHKVELTKVSDNPRYSHPLDGVIFNRYRGCDKSKASWMIDGRMCEFDSTFILKKHSPSLYITPAERNGIYLSSVPSGFSTFESKRFYLSSKSIENAMLLLAKMSAVLSKGGVAHEVWSPSGYVRYKGEVAGPVVELQINKHGILFLSCTTISDDDFDAYHLTFSNVGDMGILKMVLNKAGAISL